MAMIPWGPEIGEHKPPLKTNKLNQNIMWAKQNMFYNEKGRLTIAKSPKHKVMCGKGGRTEIKQ